jgi:hypothetical protein
MRTDYLEPWNSRYPFASLLKHFITKLVFQIVDGMSLMNHDLIQFLVFNNVATQIILEIVFNLQVETTPFLLKNESLDKLFFTNEKTVININANENDLFSFPIRQQTRI